MTDETIEGAERMLSDTNEHEERGTRVFSTAASSVERVILIVAFLASPVVSIGMVMSEVRTANAFGMTLPELLAQQGATVMTGAALLGALLLIAFIPIYLQYRGKTRIRVEATRLRLTTPAFLPLGLLSRDVIIEWDHVERVQFRMRRRLLARRPELLVVSPTEKLVLPLTDIWEVDGPDAKPPLMSAPPDSAGGWADHPLVKAAQAKQLRVQLAASEAK